MILALLLLQADPLPLPPPPPADSRIRVIDYQPDTVTTLEIAPGYELTLTLAPDEQIVTVAVGDVSTWQVAASHSGGQLFVKAAGAATSTNMTVVTSERRYLFQLRALPADTPGGAYAVSFRYPAAFAATSEPTRVAAHYTMHGAKALWPSRISDDGARTFIEWPRNVDLPATFTVDRHGEEAIVNGMFRGDRLVIDAVSPRLVFRLDHQVARAERDPVAAAH